MENLHLVKPSDELANKIKKINIEEFKEVDKQLMYILKNESDPTKQMVIIKKVLVEGQNATHEMLRFDFTVLYK